MIGRGPHRLAFTLIELLVVIEILFALLLLAPNELRRIGRLAKELSNRRPFGLSILEQRPLATPRFTHVRR